MSNFITRHPYLKQLLKRIITIIVTWNVVIICIIGTFIVMAMVGGQDDLDSQVLIKPIYGEGSKEILSIKISGPLLGSNDSANSLSGIFSDQYTYGYEVKDQLYYAATDDSIAGVILEIDSPGGTIYGARAIADGVEYYRTQTKKPVYTHIQGMGDSGAYWIAASTDKIFSDYGSDIGSIGVIMGPFEYYDTPIATGGSLLGGGVVTQNGIESINITSGRSKDIGNPYRKLTNAEIRELQRQVNNEYNDFVSFVSHHRKIDGNTIRNKIGAMSYDPKSALELRLIDAIGSRQDAYDAIAEAANVQDDFYVAREESAPTVVESLFGALGRKPQSTTSKLNLCGLAQTTLAYHGDVSKWCE